MLQAIRSSAVLRRLTGSRMALFSEEKIIADVVKPMSIDIGGMRKPYKGKNETFVEEDLVAKEPIGQFKEWFEEACNTPGIIEANAMCLATATKDGKPSARMVLLKGYGKEGFRFFTNYTSRKGQELTKNPHASVVFYWSYNGEDRSWSRQVRVEGRVERIGEEKSTEYFHSRPRSSQIGACVSPQSQVIVGRHILLDKDKQLQEEYKDIQSVIPKPESWGGFLIVPDSIEFWQGQTNRIHDRIRFRKLGEDETFDENLTKKGEDGWVYERLAP
ncbi:pyridoxine/pyridoxamine 5'-phosphate oxidase-like isoform X2 [Portunus trituberculatus]|uniref:pyridoxine/pyridoxamine 5'-phosphate oxidase-like isoform X2 n=1 Tax=Portunus trituberculatus TaxID=210409 RepID=UPI001E1CE2B6|nr:pyridoxine/pyridoxamine 5'-phosphate oxidase-like isoform X2 [Portunus trituberculatus]